MATTQNLIDETKRHLLSGQREPLNKLAVAVNTSATTLNFSFAIGDQFKAGVYLEIGLEVVYVWSVDTGALTAVVERAQLGSVAASHAIGDIVRVNPKFPEFAVLKALNDEIAGLSSPSNGLYAVRTVDLTSVGSRVGYNLAGTTGLIDIIEVRYDDYGSSNSWPLLPSWSIARQVDATDFASGLTLNTHGGLPAGRTINVTYKGSFSPLVTLADNVESVTGLSSTMLDIPPMGAALRLMAPRAFKASFTETQGEPRRAGETQSGSTSQAMVEMRRGYMRRITDEANRLVAAYPTRFPATAQAW